MEGHQKHSWTPAEEQLVIAKHHEFGPKWVQIATFLHGRSGNDVKNRWHKHITKCYAIEQTTALHSAQDPPESNHALLVEVPSKRVHDSAIERASKVGLSAFLRCVLN
jgi:hypothetical protein